VHLSNGPLTTWAGGTAAFLATPLRLRTATSRGKNNYHRGPFLHAGGEIYFCWSEFWTAAKGTEISPAFKCPSRPKQTLCVTRLWAVRPSIAALGVVNYHVLGDGKYAGLPLELDPIGGVGRKLHLPGLGPQPGDHATNRTASTKLGQ
jgi:hypothetical protein